MPRAIFALILTTFIIASIVSSSTVSAFADWAILLTLVFSLGIGIPTLFVMKSLRYGEWWQSMLGGLAIPVLVGIPIPMFIGLALAGGVIVWIIGIFRNPAFTSPKQKFPISILLTPFAAILIWMYSQALESEQVYGCITDYQPVENPTAHKHSIQTIVTDDGEEYRDHISVGSSDPENVGHCAGGKRSPKFHLRGYNYSYHGISKYGCEQTCPKQNQ